MEYVMTRAELASKVNNILVELCGEQFSSAIDEDGDIHFGVRPNGIPVGLIVERLFDDEALLAGYHVVGARAEDTAAAADFVARRNQLVRMGRYELCGDDVVF